MEETSSGLKENLAGALCYALGIVTGLFFFLTEKKNKFIRFHSLQSILLSVVWFILQTAVGALLAFTPFLVVIMHGLIGLVGVVIWVVLMVKAYQGEYFLLPALGKIALDNSEIKQ